MDPLPDNRTLPASRADTASVVADMEPLIGRVREVLAERGERARSGPAPYDLPVLRERFGFSERKRGKTEVILAEDVGVELGHPSTASQATVLVSSTPGRVRHGQVSIVGPDLEEMAAGARPPFAQVVMLEVWPGEAPDPFELESTQYLMHRLPGYMVRSVPGRLWVRVGRRRLAAGLSLQVVGSALIAAYTRDFPGVTGAEVVFITSGVPDVEAFSQIATEAAILSGRHKKLVLGVDGEVECNDLNCNACDEKPVCDSLRDIVIKRRSKTT